MSVELQPATRYARAAVHLSNAQQYLATIEEATGHEGEREEARLLRETLLLCNQRLRRAERDSVARRDEHYVRLEES